MQRSKKAVAVEALMRGEDATKYINDYVTL